MGIVASCVSGKTNLRQERESNTAPRQTKFDVVRFPSYYMEGLGEQVHKRSDDCCSTLSESSFTISAKEIEKVPVSAKEVEKGQCSTSSEFIESEGLSDESDLEEKKTPPQINVGNDDGSWKRNPVTNINRRGETTYWRQDGDIDGPSQSFSSLEEEQQSSKLLEGADDSGNSASPKLEAAGNGLPILAYSTPKGTGKHETHSYKMAHGPTKPFTVQLELGSSKASSFPVSSGHRSVPKFVPSPVTGEKKLSLPGSGLEEGLGQVLGSEAHRKLDFCIRIIFTESSAEWKSSFEGRLIRRGLEQRSGMSIGVR